MEFRNILADLRCYPSKSEALYLYLPKNATGSSFGQAQEKQKNSLSTFYIKYTYCLHMHSSQA